MRFTLLRPLYLLGLLAALVALAGCTPAPVSEISSAKSVETSSSSGPAPHRGGSLTFALEQDVVDYDPMRSRAFADRNIHFQVYDTLVRMDPQGRLIPGLAERWDVAADGLTVVLRLRQGVAFHDGTPFDAESVRWNLERNLTAQGSARAIELAPIAGVEVMDGRTVRLILKTPYTPLLATLADRAGMMVSRHAVDEAGVDFTRRALRAGTGPFILVEAVKDDHTTLERNPTWWGSQTPAGGPYLDRITVRPIPNPEARFTYVRTGEAQVANNIDTKDVAALRADQNLVYRESPGTAVDYIIPNRKPGLVFEDGRLVRAVSMALDRQEILRAVFGGSGAVAFGAIAPPHLGFDPGFRPYERSDPEHARQLVAEVGKGPLEFELLISAGNPVGLQVAQLIQGQLARADIRTNIAQLEFARVLEHQNNRSFSGAILGGWSGRMDPDGNVYDFVHSRGRSNDSSYANAEVDRLLDEQRQSSDDGRRRELLRRAEQLYAEDDPARIWYRFRMSQLITAKAVKGLQVYPDQIVRFEYAWIQPT